MKSALTEVKNNELHAHTRIDVKTRSCIYIYMYIQIIRTHDIKFKLTTIATPAIGEGNRTSQKDFHLISNALFKKKNLKKILKNVTGCKFYAVEK